MAKIRFAIDLEASDVDIEELTKVIFDGREDIANFAKDVIVRADDNIDVSHMKITAIAGACHEHATNGGTCDMCYRYAQSETLIAVPSLQ